MKGSFKLGHIAGIEIGVHYTWLFAFVFFSVSLAEGFFPERYPGWDTATYWATGIVAALLLFGSVLVHELAHSFVALAQRLRVESITLFIFGGVSSIGGDAARARDEFVIAVVGPLTSLALAGLFWVLYLGVGGDEGPVAATLFYLTLINGALAIFNILPGFPLDGGRVLRSIIWGTTGNMGRATRIAAGVGQAFGWALIGFGVFLMVSGDFLSGVWMAFIGWFLSSAAESSRRETLFQEEFGGVKVAQIMAPDPETVAPTVTVEEVVNEWFLQGSRRAAPVSEDGQLLGIVTLTDVKELPRQVWADKRVSEIMTREPLYSVNPDDDLNAAMQLLAEHRLNQLLVLRGGQLVGLLSRANVIRYLQFSHELGRR